MRMRSSFALRGFGLAGLLLTSALVCLGAPDSRAELKINPYPLLNAKKSAAPPAEHVAPAMPPREELQPAPVAQEPMPAQPEQAPQEAKKFEITVKHGDDAAAPTSQTSQPQPHTQSPPPQSAERETQGTILKQSPQPAAPMESVAVKAVPAPEQPPFAQERPQAGEIAGTGPAEVESKIDPGETVYFPGPRMGGETAPAPAAPAMIEPAAAPMNLAPRDWQAPRGADVRETLEAWSRNAGIGLLWMGNGNFSAPQTVSLQGPYEEAVTALLDQFRDSPQRPVGRLHIDPQSGAKTLVIETEGASQAAPAY